MDATLNYLVGKVDIHTLKKDVLFCCVALRSPGCILNEEGCTKLVSSRFEQSESYGFLLEFRHCKLNKIMENGIREF